MSSLGFSLIESFDNSQSLIVLSVWYEKWESGYNDVFIPAMQRLSPAYCEYHKSLQAANEVFLRHFL